MSLSPTATEMLFAIGAGPQVTAVDDQSNYPAEAPITDLSGFEPNVEAIAAKQPDLVVVADDTAGLTASLGKLGIPVLSLPAAQSFDDVYPQIEQLGAATGNVGGAAELVGQMKTDIDAVVKSLPERTTPVDVLPRARQHPVLGHLEDLHRAGVRTARLGEHRRRGRRRTGPGTRSCPRSS